MTAPDDGQAESLKIKTAFGEISAGGSVVFIVIAMCVMAGAMLWEHYKRSNEHTEIECAVKLNLFLQTQPRGEIVIALFLGAVIVVVIVLMDRMGRIG
jgi:hypothetical protein